VRDGCGGRKGGGIRNGGGGDVTGRWVGGREKRMIEGGGNVKNRE